VEENSVSQANYACCTFRGSVTALDASTGAVIWKAYTIQEEPKPRGKNTGGAQLYGPTGGGIWSTPPINAQRRAVYVGTGNGYADPPQPETDAVLAFDLDGGRSRFPDRRCLRTSRRGIRGTLPEAPSKARRRTRKRRRGRAAARPDFPVAAETRRIIPPCFPDHRKTAASFPPLPRPVRIEAF
jgi:outer membrane protein assembly factor BamB